MENMILTKQMLRDKLIFNGPLTLTEIVKLIEAEEDDRSNILVMLNALQDIGQAKLDVNTGLWESTHKLPS